MHSEFASLRFYSPVFADSKSTVEDSDEQETV